MIILERHNHIGRYIYEVISDDGTIEQISADDVSCCVGGIEFTLGANWAKEVIATRPPTYKVNNLSAVYVERD